MIQVSSIEHLKELAKSENGSRQHFCILLAGGIAKSSKQILYHPRFKTFDVVNEIDFSFQDDLTEQQLDDETNIVSAIRAGALYMY